MRLALIPILIAPLLLTGCGEEPAIQRYEVTKPVGFSWPESPAREAVHEVDGLTWVWDVPEGWMDAPEVSDLLVADYRTEGSGHALPGRATVGKFDGEAGGVNANVMRWLKQIVLTDVTGPGPIDSVLGPISHLGSEITFVDLNGHYQGEHMPTRIYGVIVQLPAEGGGVYQTWTFKLTGDRETVQQHREGLVQMALTFRPEGVPRPLLPVLDSAADQPADQPTEEPTDTP